MRKIALRSLAALLLGNAALNLSGLAHASGTQGASEGAFGSRNQDFSNTQNADRQSVDSAAMERQRAQRQLYATGRAVYSRQLTCRECPLPDGVDNQTMARDVVTRIDAGEFQLADEDKAALRAYLDRRFRLNLGTP